MYGLRYQQAKDMRRTLFSSYVKRGSVSRNASRFEVQDKGGQEMKTVKAVLIVAALFILGCGVSYGIVVGLIKLITICFSLTFSLRVATGIWLGVLLFNLLFFKGKSKE